MKKQNRKPRKSNPAKQENSTPASEPQSTRRDVLRLARNGLIAAGVLGGSGAYAVSAVRATAIEQDLSRIGAGIPAVVQIHDPTCSMCTALQHETRKALHDFDDGEIEYVVANIKTQAGSAFANHHGQPHVTLMLMDPKGEPVRILNGPQDRNTLRGIFAAHIAAFR